MKSVAPYTGPGPLKRETDRLFVRLWETGLAKLPVLGKWSQRPEAAEAGESLALNAEMPGIDPKEIAITLHRHRLNALLRSQEVPAIPGVASGHP